MSYRTFLLLLLLPYPCFPYKILVFSPANSRSHMISNGRIADTLAAAGHDVTLLEADFCGIYHSVNNSKSAKKWPVFDFEPHLQSAVEKLSTFAFKELGVWERSELSAEYDLGFNKLCRDLLDKPGLLEALRLEKFDAYFGEQLNFCGHGLAEAVGIQRKFLISSCPVSDETSFVVGTPLALSYSPAANIDRHPKMNFFERVRNFLVSMVNYHRVSSNIEDLARIFRRKFGEDFPHISDLVRESDAVFINTDELLDLPRPELPNFFHIGGLGVGKKHSGTLDKTLEGEMEKGSEGVVFFSFGTNVDTSSLPEQFMRNVFSSFESFPQFHFVVKIDAGDSVSREAAEKKKNLFLTEWAPQMAILGHRRLSAFVTHGGYNSLLEAGHSGIPLVLVPFFGDQYRNAHLVSMQGWGRYVSRFDLLQGKEVLVEALEAVLKQESYGNAARRVSHLLASKPFSAEERLVRHTEFAIASGGLPELRPEGRLLPLLARESIDVVVFVLLALLVALLVVLLVLQKLFSAVFRRTVEKSKRE